MVKFDVQAIRFLSAEHFRVLTSVEMGMKNHELVPLPLISSIAAIHRGATSRILNDLTRSRLVVYERGKKFDGFRLATLGYDFLALRALCSRGAVSAVGNQIGVGKESDIYVGGDAELKDLVLKFHRLGRTSFRKIKEKRDYHQRRHFCSWLYLSRLAAIKEFAFLQALHAHHFPVPKPIDISRHTVVMELITGPTLSNVNELKDPAALYEKLMKLIVRLGSYGLIHGDFNEFNIMLIENESPIIIDFPQMVSIDHPNADFYFNRDVQCVRVFFQRRFKFDGQEWPKFENIQRRHNLDAELEASGFTKKMRKDLNKAYDEGNFAAHLEDDSSNSSEEEDEEDENGKIDEEHDLEELKDIEHEYKEAGSKLRNSKAFQNWLEQAHVELESTEEGLITVDELCGMLGDEREAKAREVIQRTKTIDEKAEKEEQDEHEDLPEKSDQSGRNVEVGKKKEAGSILSAGSTIIPPEEVKRRLLMQRNRTKKEKLRVKGQQSAVRRGRQQNKELIREYAGWDCY